MNPLVPTDLYDLSTSLAHGGSVRACGYLMRRRIEHLLDQPDGMLGLRRATHVGSLVEVGYRSYETAPGFFSLELKYRLAECLEKARATLQPQEKHFADLAWWESLDRAQVRAELRSNLDRLLKDEPTTCLTIGIELQLIYDIMMRAKYGSHFISIITDADRLNGTVRVTYDYFHRILLQAAA